MLHQSYANNMFKMQRTGSALLAGGEVDLEGRVEAAVLGLLAGAAVGRARAAGASLAVDLGVLGSRARAGALAGGTGAARAAGSGDVVLGGSLVALALKGRHLAARAGSLLG